jgi:hypothetical protein
MEQTNKAALKGGVSDPVFSMRTRKCSDRILWTNWCKRTIKLYTQKAGNADSAVQFSVT